jgi:hypothetical protein
MSPPIAVSLRARGAVIGHARALSAGYQAREAAREVRDLGVAACLHVALLSWTTWLSAGVALLSTVFFSLYDGGRVQLDGSLLLPLCFLVYLPALWLLNTAYARRQAALRDLAEG